MKKNMVLSAFLVSTLSLPLYSMEESNPSIDPFAVYLQVIEQKIENPHSTTPGISFKPLLDLFYPGHNSTFYTPSWFAEGSFDPMEANILKAHPDEESLQYTDLALKLAATMYVAPQRFSLFGFCQTLRDNKEEILKIIDEAFEHNSTLNEGKNRLAGIEISATDDAFATVNTEVTKPAYHPKPFPIINAKSFAAGCFTTLGIMSIVYALPKVYHWIRG